MKFSPSPCRKQSHRLTSAVLGAGAIVRRVAAGPFRRSGCSGEWAATVPKGSGADVLLRSGGCDPGLPAVIMRSPFVQARAITPGNARSCFIVCCRSLPCSVNVGRRLELLKAGMLATFAARCEHGQTDPGYICMGFSGPLQLYLGVFCRQPLDFSPWFQRAIIKVTICAEVSINAH